MKSSKFQRLCLDIYIFFNKEAVSYGKLMLIHRCDRDNLVLLIKRNESFPFFPVATHFHLNVHMILPYMMGQAHASIVNYSNKHNNKCNISCIA